MRQCWIIIICVLVIFGVVRAPAQLVNCVESNGRITCPNGFASEDQNTPNATVRTTPRANEPLLAKANATQFPLTTPTPGTLRIGADFSGPTQLEEWYLDWLSRDGLSYFRAPLRKLYAMLRGTVTVEWYGAKCNGTTDDTAALTAAFTALPSSGGTIRLCAPMKLAGGSFSTKPLFLLFPDNFSEITTSAPIIFKNMQTCGIYGRGAGYSDGSVLRWAGTNDPTVDPAVIELWNVQSCTLDSFSIAATSNQPYQAGILSAKIRDQGFSTAPRYNQFRNLQFWGNDDEVWGGIRMAGGVCIGGTRANQRCADSAAGTTFCSAGGGVCSQNADNSENSFKNIRVSHANGACAEIGHAESLGNAFEVLACSAALTSQVSTGNLQCGVATAGGRCVSAVEPGLFCMVDADCSGNGVCDFASTNQGTACPNGNSDCTGGGACIKCGRAGSPAGNYSVEHALISGAQKSLFCYGANGQPFEVNDIDSESANSVAFTASSTSANSDFHLQNMRFSLNRAGPARVCRDGSNDGAACTLDGDCTGGGFCSGCTASGLFAMGKALCVGGSNPGVACPGGTECTGGGTCTYQTKKRSCCTANGVGADCLKLIYMQTNGNVSMNDIQFKTALSGTITPQPFTFNINGGTGGPSLGSAKNIFLATSAPDMFVVAHPATESWEASNIIIENPNGTETQAKSQASAPRFYARANSKLAVDVDLAAIPTPAGTPTPFKMRPEIQKCIRVDNLVDTDDNQQFWIANQAAVVTGISCHCSGDCSTLATFSLANRSGPTNMTITGGSPTCSTGTTLSTRAVIAQNNALAAGDGITFSVTNTPSVGTGNQYEICIDLLYW